MKEEKLLTVVVPVYKVEPYINKCLDSCLIYKDGELDEELMGLIDVLIINDGTPDKSADMSREYAERYPKYFRQIDKANGGHGSVWNMGVQEAKGRYVKFLDSDDWFQNFGKFVEALRHTDSDLVLTPTRCHCEHDEIWRQEILDMEFYKIYDADQFDWVGNRTHNYLLHHCCCYKRGVLWQYMPGLFLEKQPYDDVVLWPAAMIGAKTIEAFDFPLYNYLMDRPGQSISREIMNKQAAARIKANQQAIRFYEEHPVAEGTKADFIRHRLPRSYNIYYRQSVSMPYTDGKRIAADWDKWVRESNPRIQTIWIRMYRMMPYWSYRMMVNAMQGMTVIKGWFKKSEGTYSQEK